MSALSTALCVSGMTLMLAAAQEKVGPQPKVVDPGPPPSDAIVLFGGEDLSEWVHKDGRPAQWTVQNEAMVCKSGTGDLYSRRKLASAQIHLEFSEPLMPAAKGQARGNSGVYIQGRYEIQVLDSYRNPTYADGSCGAVYGQHAPLVNACRPPETWQSYDIIFHAPQCDAGQVTAPATVTILQNGVLIQDHAVILQPTAGGEPDNPCDPGPLMLQDHHHPDVKETQLRFRNIWYRPL
jgi:hypothetical protein